MTDNQKSGLLHVIKHLEKYHQEQLEISGDLENHREFCIEAEKKYEGAEYALRILKALL